jgi:hypothetical protein
VVQVAKEARVKSHSSPCHRHRRPAADRSEAKMKSSGEHISHISKRRREPPVQLSTAARPEDIDEGLCKVQSGHGVFVAVYCCRLLLSFIAAIYCCRSLLPFITSIYCSYLFYCSHLLFPFIAPIYCSHLLLPLIAPVDCYRLLLQSLLPCIAAVCCCRVLLPFIAAIYRCHLSLPFIATVRDSSAWSRSIDPGSRYPIDRCITA